MLRRQFLTDINRRFNALKKSIKEVVVDQDSFGLSGDPQSIPRIVSNLQFDFATTTEKVAAFNSWLREQQGLGVLEVVTRPNSRFGTQIQQPWTNAYINTAYRRGLARARTELKKRGYEIPEAAIPGAALAGGSVAALGATLGGPVHIDRVGMLYTRTFSDLEGITAAMDAQISRILAQGLADGINARELGNQLGDRVDKIGRTRGRTLARTEIVRAHHQAMIEEYRAIGVGDVVISAEWGTALDGRVCEQCAPLHGRVFTLDEIQRRIPLHPNCRCVALPFDPSDRRQIADAKKERKFARGFYADREATT
jgi:SPP1 gp7 family putative phage head morphogenesis protein